MNQRLVLYISPTKRELNNFQTDFKLFEQYLNPVLHKTNIDFSKEDVNFFLNKIGKPLHKWDEDNIIEYLKNKINGMLSRMEKVKNSYEITYYPIIKIIHENFSELKNYNDYGLKNGVCKVANLNPLIFQELNITNILFKDLFIDFFIYQINMSQNGRYQIWSQGIRKMGYSCDCKLSECKYGCLETNPDGGRKSITYDADSITQLSFPHKFYENMWESLIKNTLEENKNNYCRIFHLKEEQ